jgi:hypothetical protein
MAVARRIANAAVKRCAKQPAGRLAVSPTEGLGYVSHFGFAIFRGWTNGVCGPDRPDLLDGAQSCEQRTYTDY